MTVIDRAPKVRQAGMVLGHRPRRWSDGDRIRLAARLLITVVVALAIVATGQATSPATTFLLGIAAIVWLLMSFEMEHPSGR